MKLANHNPDTLAAAIEKAHDRQDHIEKALVRLAGLQAKNAAPAPAPVPAPAPAPVAAPAPAPAPAPAAGTNDGTGLIVDPQQAAVTAAVAAFANGQ